MGRFIGIGSGYPLPSFLSCIPFLFLAFNPFLPSSFLTLPIYFYLFIPLLHPSCSLTNCSLPSLPFPFLPFPSTSLLIYPSYFPFTHSSNQFLLPLIPLPSSLTILLCFVYHHTYIPFLQPLPTLHPNRLSIILSLASHYLASKPSP